MKSDPCELLFKGIRTVMAGQYWVGRECMGSVIDSMRERVSAPGPEPARPTFGLTPRELEVVSAVVAGYPNRDIAERFSISIKTVKHHLTNIFDKVGVSNRLELALFAVHHRLAAGGVAHEASSNAGVASARLRSPESRLPARTPHFSERGEPRAVDHRGRELTA